MIGGLQGGTGVARKQHASPDGGVLLTQVKEGAEQLKAAVLSLRLPSLKPADIKTLLKNKTVSVRDISQKELTLLCAKKDPQGTYVSPEARDFAAKLLKMKKELSWCWEGATLNLSTLVRSADRNQITARQANMAKIANGKD